jgi:toxin ParE1/3/4
MNESVNLIISEQAEQDLDGIEAYIGNENRQTAVRFVQRLTERFEQLMNYPRSGKKQSEIAPELRSVAEGNYIIFYRINDHENVEIAPVLHSKRNLRRILSTDSE